MPGAHENLERAEQAAHHGSTNKIFGVTMALLGVLIAFCGALVGSERNELTRTMIEQTQAHSNFTGASTKLRLIMIELEKQHARVAAARDPQGGWSPVPRFIELAGDYKAERGLSKAWTESYQPIVNAHFDAAEGFERAQLLAEIGIVFASLGVLLGSRSAWVTSLVLGLVCTVQIGRTYVPTHHTVQHGLIAVRQAEEAFENLRKAHAGGDEDEKAIARLDPDGSIRTALTGKAPVEPAANTKVEAKK